ncbi:hypothetical protein AUK22_09515 [bacterium CG2_30_54_10]|nr:MAG: hypothetical protein AUK22_09515 [bacterium CG2_30_54_10]
MGPGDWLLVTPPRNLTLLSDKAFEFGIKEYRVRGGPHPEHVSGRQELHRCPPWLPLPFTHKANLPLTGVKVDAASCRVKRRDAASTFFSPFH